MLLFRAFFIRLGLLYLIRIPFFLFPPLRLLLTDFFIMSLCVTQQTVQEHGIGPGRTLLQGLFSPQLPDHLPYQLLVILPTSNKLVHNLNENRKLFYKLKLFNYDVYLRWCLDAHKSKYRDHRSELGVINYKIDPSLNCLEVVRLVGPIRPSITLE